MRVALIVVAIAFAASPLFASPSCMTQAEARKHFGNKHLYWHGPNRCWDATPGRRQLAQRIKAKEQPRNVREPQVERQAERALPEEKKPPRWTLESRWREAMSKMLPEDYASLQSPARAQADSEPVEAPAPRIAWRDRWVDVVPRVPPVVDKSEPSDISLAAASARRAEPTVTPMRVMLALLAFVLMLGIVEIVNRGDRGMVERARRGATDFAYAVFRFSMMLRKSAARLR
jgi:hypothetical protein